MVVIKTPRLILRPYRLSDVEDLYRNIQDPRIHRMTLSIPNPYTRADARQWARQNSAAAHRRKKKVRLIFAIEHQGEVIGDIGLHRIDAHSAELGYWLARHVRGQGLMPEAVAALTTYAFRALGLNRVYANVFIHNAASQRTLEKAAFQREGTLRKAAWKNGPIDVALYAKVR